MALAVGVKAPEYAYGYLLRLVRLWLLHPSIPIWALFLSDSKSEIAFPPPAIKNIIIIVIIVIIIIVSIIVMPLLLWLALAAEGL